MTRGTPDAYVGTSEDGTPDLDVDGSDLATQDEVDALDAAVLHKATDEAVTGVKDFTEPFRIGRFTWAAAQAKVALEGAVAKVTDSFRGLALRGASGWFSLTGQVANVREFGAVGDGATDDTAAIQAAIDTGFKVLVPDGTYNVTGLVFPAVGKFFFEGYGPGLTDLHNTHASNATLTIAGVGGVDPNPYAERFQLKGFRLSAASLNTDQAGLSVTLARDFSVEDVQVVGAGKGLAINSMWRCLWKNVMATSCNTGWHFVDSAYAGSTPTSFINCSATSCVTGLQIDADMDLMGWDGGDITGNGTGLVVLGNTSRNILFKAVNFEANTGVDVTIGDGSTGPIGLSFMGCRFWRTITGNLSIDYIRGSRTAFVSCSWQNYTKAIASASSAGLLTIVSPTAVSVGTFATLNTNTISTPSTFIEGSGAGFTRIGDVTRFNQAQVVFAKGIVAFGGPSTIGGVADSLGFYGATPVARPAAYTQTYATPTRTHAARTAQALTDNSGGTAADTIPDVPAAYDEATVANIIASLVDEINKLRADQINTAQVLNQALDDLQANGLLQ